MPVDSKIPKYAQATPDADYVPHYADSKSRIYDTPDADYIPDYAKSNQLLIIYQDMLMLIRLITI